MRQTAIASLSNAARTNASASRRTAPAGAPKSARGELRQLGPLASSQQWRGAACRPPANSEKLVGAMPVPRAACSPGT